jgi:hypothetical protein
MKKILIECPYCKNEIYIDEILAQKIRAELEQEFKKKLMEKDKELKEIKEKLTAKDEELLELKRKFEEEYKRKLNEERLKIREEIKKEYDEEKAQEIKIYKEQMNQLKDQIKAFKEKELQLLQEKQQLEKEKEEIELTVARKLDEERKKIFEDLKTSLEKKYELVLADKDRQINILKTQIEELQRKLEKNIVDGETLEWILEKVLKEFFPNDIIEPVPRGKRGADVIQKVCDARGNICGVILWESKRTKEWNNQWIDKLKEDQREIKADIAVIVSTVLPKDIKNIAFINGIWVADYRLTTELATLLRFVLLEVARAKIAMEGKQEKQELLYQYLTSSEFRQKIQTTLESFIELKKDLDNEKRAMQKIWAKREKQIEKAIKSMASIYGSLQGIIGKTLPELRELELKALESTELVENRALSLEIENNKTFVEQNKKEKNNNSNPF